MNLCSIIPVTMFKCHQVLCYYILRFSFSKLHAISALSYVYNKEERKDPNIHDYNGRSICMLSSLIHTYHSHHHSSRSLCGLCCSNRQCHRNHHGTDTWGGYIFCCGCHSHYIYYSYHELVLTRPVLLMLQE